MMREARTIAPPRQFAPTKEYRNVLVLNSLETLDPNDLRKRKYLCVDYNRIDLREFVQWLEDFQFSAFSAGIKILKITVLADFDKLRPGEAIFISGQLEKTVATVADYPNDAETFDEAVMEFDRELEKVKRGMVSYNNSEEVEAHPAETEAVAG